MTSDKIDHKVLSISLSQQLLIVKNENEYLKRQLKELWNMHKWLIKNALPENYTIND